MIHFFCSRPVSYPELSGISWTACRKVETSSNGTVKVSDESCEMGARRLGVFGIGWAEEFDGRGTFSTAGGLCDDREDDPGNMNVVRAMCWAA
jgi:hypothetical protein